MRKDRKTALRLRLLGKSYTEIKRELGIPKSTLSGWFSNLVLSQRLQERIQRRGRKQAMKILLHHGKQQTERAQRRASEIRKRARKNIPPLSNITLQYLGLALYWAEGYKRAIVRNGKERTFHPVSLTNSDPNLVKLFVRFLNEVLHVPREKIKASIRIYQHQNERELIRFWHATTKIPLSNFRKTYYGISRSSQGKRPYTRLPYGVIQVLVADTKLYHHIMGSLEGIHNKL